MEAFRNLKLTTRMTPVDWWMLEFYLCTAWKFRSLRSSEQQEIEEDNPLITPRLREDSEQFLGLTNDREEIHSLYNESKCYICNLNFKNSDAVLPWLDSKSTVHKACLCRSSRAR